MRLFILSYDVIFCFCVIVRLVVVLVFFCGWVRKKDVLWEFKVVDMDKDVDILKIWYRFICICFICFMYRKFGDGFGELIERDCWIF